MNQIFDRALPRFSRRHVTKRKFNILGSPSIPVLQDVQSINSDMVSTQKGKASMHRPNIQNHKKGPQNMRNLPSTSTGKKARTDDSVSSSPLALLKEHKENEPSRDTSIRYTDSDQDDGEDDHTPQKQQKLGGPDTPGAPVDVSVSFLASTPKPGRLQLSRRRPLTSVRVNSEGSSSVQESAITQEQSRKMANKDKANKQNVIKTLPRNQIVRTLPRKSGTANSTKKQITGSPLKAGTSIDEKIASLNRLRVMKKGKSKDMQSRDSVNDGCDEIKNRTTGTSRHKSASIIQGDLHRTRSGSKKQQKSSVPVKTILVTTSNSVYEQEVTHSNSDDRSEDTDVSELQISKKISVGYDKISKTGSVVSQCKDKSVNNKRAGASNTDDSSSGSVLVREKAKHISNTRQKKTQEQTVEEVDATLQDGDAILSRQRRKSAVNRKLQAISRKNDLADSSGHDQPDEMMMIWNTDGQKRTRSDLIDLDVILNIVTEMLAAKMDVYDTDEELSAVRLLEKYLAQDLTKMIQCAQNVKVLQSKIKECGQSIKQKQKCLMSVQKERIELEETCQPMRDAQERNENMTLINEFLKDLGTVINKC